MTILPVNSMQYCALRYRVNSGGVDVASLRRLTDKEQPEEAVKVTISKEAQELFNKLVEAQTR